MVRGDAVRRALWRIVESRHGAHRRRTTERLRSIPEAGCSQMGRAHGAGRGSAPRRSGGSSGAVSDVLRGMAKVLRIAGTDLVWELDDSVDLASCAKEIATARASNQFVTLMARLPGQSEFAHVTLVPGQLAWWSLGEESDPSAMGWGQ